MSSTEKNSDSEDLSSIYNQIAELDKNAANMKQYMERTETQHSNFVDCSKSFSDGVLKLFNLMWVDMRKGQKENTGNSVTNAKIQISEQLLHVIDLIVSIINSLTISIGFFYDNEGGKPLSLTALNTAITSIFNSIENLYTIIDKLSNQSKLTKNDVLLPHFKARYLEATDKFVSALVNSESEFLRLEIQHLNSLQESDTSKSKAKRAKKEGKTYSEILTDFYHSTLSKLLQIAIDIFSEKVSATAQQFINIVDSIQELVEIVKEDFDENEEEEEFDKPDSAAKTFINDQYVNIVDLYLKTIKTLWIKSAQMSDVFSEPQYGDKIVDIIEIDSRRLQPHITIEEICNLYKKADEYDDKQTAINLNEFIIHFLQDKEEEITDIVQQEATIIQGGIDEFIPEKKNEEIDISSITSKSTMKTSGTRKTSKSKYSAMKREKDPQVSMYEEEMTQLNKNIAETVNQVYFVISSARQTSENITSKVYINEEEEEEEEDPIRNNLDEYSDILNSINNVIYEHFNFISQHIATLKTRSPRKAGQVTNASEASKSIIMMRASSRTRGDGQSISSLSSSAFRASNKKMEVELHIARFAQLTAEELLITANRNILFSEIRNKEYNRSEGYKDLKNKIKNIGNFTTQYCEHLSLAREESRESVNIEELEEIERKTNNIQENPMELADAFNNSFRETICMVLDEYFVKLNKYQSLIEKRKVEMDNELDNLFEEKMKIHHEERVVFMKKYLVKKERQRQRGVPEAENLIEEAKKLALAGKFDEAREKKEMCYEVEDKIIQERIEKIEKSEKKEYKELEETQKRELSQIEDLIDRTLNRKVNKYKKKIENLKDSLLPLIMSRERGTLDIIAQCVQSVTNINKVSPKSKGKEKNTTVKSQIKKSFDNIIKEVLHDYNMKIEDNTIVEISSA